MRLTEGHATRLSEASAKSDRISDHSSMRLTFGHPKRSHSQFSNYSGINAVANSGNHSTWLAPHPLHTYNTLAAFIPI